MVLILLTRYPLPAFALTPIKAGSGSIDVVGGAPSRSP
jgi:hypothetical protein